VAGAVVEDRQERGEVELDGREIEAVDTRDRLPEIRNNTAGVYPQGDSYWVNQRSE